MPLLLLTPWWTVPTPRWNKHAQGRLVGELGWNRARYLCALADGAKTQPNFQVNADVVAKGIQLGPSDAGALQVEFDQQRHWLLLSSDGTATMTLSGRNKAKAIEREVAKATRPPFWHLLRDSIQAVNLNRYAVGVIGLAATVGIILGILKDPTVAVFGILILIALIVLLMVLGWVKQHGNYTGRLVAPVLILFIAIVFCGTIAMLWTQYFFNWPAHSRNVHIAPPISFNVTHRPPSQLAELPALAADKRLRCQQYLDYLALLVYKGDATKLSAVRPHLKRIASLLGAASNDPDDSLTQDVLNINEAYDKMVNDDDHSAITKLNDELDRSFRDMYTGDYKKYAKKD